MVRFFCPLLPTGGPQASEAYRAAIEAMGGSPDFGAPTIPLEMQADWIVYGPNPSICGPFSLRRAQPVLEVPIVVRRSCIHSNQCWMSDRIVPRLI